MFEGYNKKGLSLAFGIPFLLVFLPSHDAGWPLCATLLAALVPTFLGLAFFTHRAKWHVTTISLLSSAATMLVLAALIITGSLNPIIRFCQHSRLVPGCSS